jgi:hypothetical protein
MSFIINPYLYSSVFSSLYSVLLNGSTQYINADTVVENIKFEKGTYSMWIKFNGATSINANFLKASVNGSNQISIAYINSTSKFRFTYKGGGELQKAEVTTSEESAGNWTHLAMTWDTSADELKGYVNGSQVGGTQSSLGVFEGTIDKCYFGKNTLADNSYFKGYIDEISIFDEVINMSNLYDSGTPIDVSALSDLVGYWKMEEGTGTSTADSSGTGSTGTLVNTPIWSSTTPTD